MGNSLLFVLPNLFPGGAERTIVGLVRELSTTFQVHVALIDQKGALLDELPKKASLHHLGGPYKFIFRLPMLVRELKPCAVISTVADVNLLVTAMKTVFPKTAKVILRDAAAPMTAFSEMPLPRVWQYLYRKTYAKADAVVALTLQAKKTLESLGVEGKNIVVIHNAVSSERISSGGVGYRSVAGEIRAVSVGRLDYLKGYDLLIKSLPRVLSHIPDFKLTIIGEGKQRHSLTCLIEELGLQGKVVLAGHIPNPTPYVKAADLFILPSRSEGMSNAVLESLCCGTPVLTTNHDKNASDEFIKDGVNGFLINDCAVESIESGIIRAVENLVALNRENIATSAMQDFSYEKHVDGYRRLFHRVCRKNAES